jgi:hypothetical protein
MEIKIKLKIKDIEIELTQNEAKELNDFLNVLFGEKAKEITMPIIIERWKEWYPRWTYPSFPVWYSDTKTQCNTISYEVS